MLPPRLVMFSGLAADERLFAPQRRRFPDLEVPAWLAPLAGETLSRYAQRMAGQIAPDPRRRLFLGGVSFGAIVALEASRHLPASGVFLIGGGLSQRMITWPFRWMCHVAPFVPLPLLPLLLKLFPLGLDLIEDLTDEQKALYVAMSRETSPAMIRWGAHAMTGWEWTGPLPANVHAIHGHDDRIVHPDPRLHPQLVRRGRHLISLSHPDEVNRFMAAHMERTAAGGDGTGATSARP